MKVCSCCWKEKPFSEFYEREFTSDGYQYHCKECLRTRRKLYYKKNKEFAVAVKKKHEPKKEINRKLSQIEKLISEIRAILD